MYDAKFTVVTDNNPLTYALSKAKLDATSHRWLSSLASYDFNIVYRPGSSNVDADGLSRYPGNQDCTEIHNDSVKVTSACIVTTPFHTIKSVDILEATESPGQPVAQVGMTSDTQAWESNCGICIRKQILELRL